MRKKRERLREKCLACQKVSSTVPNSLARLLLLSFLFLFFFIRVHLCAFVVPVHLSDGRELVAALPLDGELREQTAARGLGFGRLDERERFAAGHLQQIKIADRVGDVKAELAVLARAEKFAGP